MTQSFQCSWRLTSATKSPASIAVSTSSIRRFCRWAENRGATLAAPAVITRDLLERYRADVFLLDRSPGRKSGLLIRGIPESPVAGLTPAQIRSGYGFNSVSFGTVVGNGNGQTIAIVDAYNDPKIRADIKAFDTLYGLPAPSLTVINQSGKIVMPGSVPAPPQDQTRWIQEIDLDVEWAHALAPGAAIVLAEAGQPAPEKAQTAGAPAPTYNSVRLPGALQVAR